MEKKFKINAQADRALTMWRKGSISRIGRSYHIVNDGIINREDYNILFENEKGKCFIPKETTDSINIYSDVMFSANFFKFMNNSGINVNIFDKYGRFVGTFLPSENTDNAKTMLKQAAIYLDDKKRIDIAKRFEDGAMHNILSNLKYYGRRKEGEFVESITEIENIVADIKRTDSINALMLLEAKARRIYYSMFNLIIGNGDFAFAKRTKQPPMDPLNALISFGNVFLYNRVATEIAKTSLDIRVGFLHATGDRSRSLNLDISEVFKPLIVDRTIFTIINRRMIDAYEHFRKCDDDGIYMNTEGKAIFLQELENKLNLVRQEGGKSMTYLSRIKEEIGKINRMVHNGTTYKPYKYKN